MSNSTAEVQTLATSAFEQSKLRAPDPQIHYHVGMAAGENTLNAMTARVVQQSMVAAGGSYDAQDFLDRYTRFMATPGSHNDSYAEAFHRQVSCW
eukprot:SAG31_NODE_7235_length_1747_cov_1.135233_2_plen_95_part_00